MPGRVRMVAWRVKEPQRVEAASVVLCEDRLTARGTSAGLDRAWHWSLDAGSGWVTRELRVWVGVGDAERSLPCATTMTASGRPPEPRTATRKTRRTTALC